MSDSLGYVLLDRQTLQLAEERAQAEASSAVVSRAVKTGRRRSAAEQRFWDWVDAGEPTAATVLAFTRGDRNG